MRVQIQPHPVVPAVVLGLAACSASAVVLWLDRLDLPWQVAGAGVLAAVMAVALWFRARSRLATGLFWDGQRWFASIEGQADEPIAGQLALKLDFDGYSLLRFAPEHPSRGVKTPRWLMATPANVRGPWQDWRAAVIHAQRARAVP